MEILSSENPEKAAEILREGGAVVYPTETVYGLGADATDPEAVERVYSLKGRSRDEPVSVATTLERVGEVVETEGYGELLGSALPGPVTLLLPARRGLPEPLVRDGKVGLRVPDDPVALRLLEESPPLTSTSANLSGEEPATEPGEVDLEGEPEAAIDAGPREGEPSTVYDAVEGRVVREGAVPSEELRP